MRYTFQVHVLLHNGYGVCIIVMSMAVYSMINSFSMVILDADLDTHNVMVILQG